MKQTIEINVPEGYTAKWNEKTKQLDLVKNSTKSHSWEEFCKNHPVIEDNEYYLGDNGPLFTFTSNKPRLTNTRCLSCIEDAQGISALIQLTRLHDEWVGDWTPDGIHGKYVIHYDLLNKDIIINIWNETGFLLSFPTKGMAEEFFDCFKDLIETAKKFI